MRRAFTLIEVIVVIAIIGVLVAILTPVLVASKKAAKVTSSIARLRQCYMATTMYMSEYGNGTVGGDYYQSGIPTKSYYYIDRFHFSEEFITSPCGFDEELFGTGPNFVPGWLTFAAIAYEPRATGFPPHLVGYFEEYGENAVAWIDTYCNEPGLKLNNPMTTKRALAVSLGGQLMNRKKKGNGLDLRFYSEKPLR